MLNKGVRLLIFWVISSFLYDVNRNRSRGFSVELEIIFPSTLEDNGCYDSICLPVFPEYIIMMEQSVYSTCCLSLSSFN